MFKFIKKILGFIITVVILFAAVVAISGKCYIKFDGADEYYSHWMMDIEDDCLISEIVIPGSHDAGTKGMVWLGETQCYTVEEQLLSGVRYFDLRVNQKDGEFVIFHSIINGAKFIPILQDIYDFIIENPTEVLLLDFQHFSGGSQHRVRELIEEFFASDDLLVVNDTDKSDLQFISELTVGEARGKCIVFWGDRSDEFAQKNYLFIRNNDTCSLEGVSLNSYYYEEYHKGTSKALIYEAFPEYYARIDEKFNNEGYKGIFVLQAQLTDGYLIFGPWARERSHNKNVSEYIDNLKQYEESRCVNVIMRDFITVEKCDQIIRQNFE